MVNIEKLIFENVLYNDDYNRKVLPFLEEEYFADKKDKTVFGLINSYFQKYNKFPPVEALKVDLTALKTLDEQEFKNTFAYIESFENAKKDLTWLLDKTEEFCKDKALYNALMQAIKIVNEEKDSRYSKGAIPSILQDALAVSFDTSVGHDFLADADERFEYYQRKIKKIPFDIDLLNTITDGGLVDGTVASPYTLRGPTPDLRRRIMEIVVRGRNVNVTERVEEYVEKKVGKLERYLPIIDEARMELSQEETRSAQHRMIAQLTVRSRGKILRAEERDQDLFAAIDRVAEKMQRQITRFKDRLYSRGQVRGVESVRVPAEAEPAPEAIAEVETVRAIVRTKKFLVTPMGPEEAIEQMELLGHDFFVFYNSDVGGINVLYRRRSGDYGLLQPELA